MNTPIISIVVAVNSSDRSIGKNNQLLWSIPEDMKHFREVTTGHPVIMGRKTFDSIPKKFRPLPGRKNIVVTRDSNWSYENVVSATSIESAIEKAKEFDDQEIFIIGGEQIYKLGLPYADRLYITVVETDLKGDTFFPEYTGDFTKVISEKDSGDENFKYIFLVLER